MSRQDIEKVYIEEVYTLENYYENLYHIFTGLNKRNLCIGNHEYPITSEFRKLKDSSTTAQKIKPERINIDILKNRISLFVIKFIIAIAIGYFLGGNWMGEQSTVTYKHYSSNNVYYMATEDNNAVEYETLWVIVITTIVIFIEIIIYNLYHKKKEKEYIFNRNYSKQIKEYKKSIKSENINPKEKENVDIFKSQIVQTENQKLSDIESTDTNVLSLAYEANLIYLNSLMNSVEEEILNLYSLGILDIADKNYNSILKLKQYISEGMDLDAAVDIYHEKSKAGISQQSYICNNSISDSLLKMWDKCTADEFNNSCFNLALVFYEFIKLGDQINLNINSSKRFIHEYFN